MKTIKSPGIFFIFCCSYLLCGANAHAQSVSLQSLMEGMSSNNDLIKYYTSLVQSKQAELKSVGYDRLPRINTVYQATIGSDNNVQGSYLTMGIIPSVTGGSRSYSKLDAVSGNTALAGIDWEVVNFGGYKARQDLAKSGVALQNNVLAKTTYDLKGIAAAYYLELLRQYELKSINQDNVLRLQQLMTSINTLITNGIRPGVDSSIASSELSKSKVALYEAQKNLEQIQVQLATLSMLPSASLIPDTATVSKIVTDGGTYVQGALIDTLNHPDINLYTSLVDLSRSRLQLEKKRYYPKLMLDADVWSRASSLTSSDVYNSDLSNGYVPQRLNYFVGLTLTYDLMNIVRKRLNSNIYKFEADASEHQLQQEKDNITGELQRALIENRYQLNRLRETEHQLQSASIAYQQQENLYRNGLSSVIDLNIALNYFIQARKDRLDSKVGYMRSVLTYSLVTNSFNSMVQALKL